MIIRVIGRILLLKWNELVGQSKMIQERLEEDDPLQP
jgi:hypothetical protein